MFGTRGVNHCIVSACASGTHSIGEAAEVIKRDEADVIIAGGTESSMVPVILAGLLRDAGAGRRARRPDPRPPGRSTSTGTGFVMAEGAAVLLVEELEHAKARGARSTAR